MEVILLVNKSNLGSIGDIVNVAPGYARNFLLPRKMVMRATEENRKIFEEKRAILEQANKESKDNASQLSEKIAGLEIITLRQASEDGKLYGSVSSKEIAKYILAMRNIKVEASSIHFDDKIKTKGVYKGSIQLHSEIAVAFLLVVAQTDSEASRILAEYKQSTTSVAASGDSKIVKENEEIWASMEQA